MFYERIHKTFNGCGYSKIQQAKDCIKYANSDMYIIDYGVSGSSSNLLFKELRRVTIENIYKNNFISCNINYILVVASNKISYTKHIYTGLKQKKIKVPNSKCVLNLKHVFNINKPCLYCHANMCIHIQSYISSIQLFPICTIHIITHPDAHNFEVIKNTC